MIKKWKIVGYAGFDDYDGVADNNLNMTIEMDSFFNKEDISTLIFNKFKSKHRVVVLNIQELKI